jgi:curved DNA-binding protein CbpA
MPELKKAYLTLAKKYHPDLYSGTNTDHFRRVNEAYATLKIPAKRADYDNRLKIRTNHSAAETEGYQPQKEETKTRETQDPEFEAAF